MNFHPSVTEQLFLTPIFSGTSFHSEKLSKLKDIIPKDEPIVFVVGAMAHGSVRLPIILM